MMGECATGKITSYLETVYESVAETLPDVKDDGVETTLELDGDHNPVDAYAIALTKDGCVTLPARPAKSAKKTIQKQRKRKGSLELHVERLPEHSNLQVKFLPPGCMKDYYDQFRALDEVGHRVSFSTFFKVWKVEFGHLKFRPETSHSQCSACMHHKLMIRALGHFLVAKKAQCDLYARHLMAQYRDRQVYWSLRANARLQATGTITIILDGMDQCKFSYPRSPATKAKELAGLIRPRLHIVGCVVHGRSLNMYVSNHNKPKDSSVMAEILCNVLSRLSKVIDLARHCVHVISDNTSRETKNNTILRLLAAWTSHGTILQGSLRNLRSGHSHEDIDQIFGNVAMYLVRHARNVQVPEEFVQVIQGFCATAHRPFERERAVIKLDMHRPWFFRSYMSFLIFQFQRTSK